MSVKTPVLSGRRPLKNETRDGLRDREHLGVEAGRTARGEHDPVDAVTVARPRHEHIVGEIHEADRFLRRKPMPDRQSDDERFLPQEPVRECGGEHGIVNDPDVEGVERELLQLFR